MKEKKVPTFKKPANEMTDIQLINGMVKVTDFFDNRAAIDRCPGDMFSGWDWPTMWIVHPELCEKHAEFKAEAKRRLALYNGKFAGQKYVPKGSGWVLAGPVA